MKVIVFGATGMVGQGVLRESLLASDVEQVLTVGRSATGQQHPKLRELVHKDTANFSAVERDLTGFDACFFCLGISSAGMKEDAYTRVTYDIAVAAATVLARANPKMTFVYVSGEGTDSTEQGRSMWARVKGKTENALLKLPFKAAYMFRPAMIQPTHGTVSKTTLYRLFYAVSTPVFPLLKAAFPKYVTTNDRVGQAMLEVARKGFSKPIVTNADINVIAAGAKS